MSLPQRLQMATGLDKEKQSPLAAMFPSMSFFPPVTTSASVFPNPMMFPPQFQQFYANLVQQQLLQIAQHQQQQSPALRSDHSPSLSDRASSGAETPAIKKLQVDEDGCPICPICSEKLPEKDWAEHVEEEKRKLRESIASVKEQRVPECGSSSIDSARRKRECELKRIRGNQAKRMALKRSQFSLSRNSLTPFGSQSADLLSPEIKQEDDGNMKCFTCTRTIDFGLVSSSFDNARCQECFDMLRAQTISLPATLTGSPLDMRLNASESSGSADLSPPEKRAKYE